MKKIIITITVLLSQFTSYATTKIYLIHGYGGIGIEMKEIQKSIDKKGFNSEIFSYPSLTEDVDSVGISLFKKIQSENYDTVSFVTHSMGALVVRSLYEHIDSLSTFPFIHRIVMIAPPNNGSPVADFFAQFSFVKHIIGPNINNLTTNPNSGAGKYPIPTCEVGLIAGSFTKERGYNIFVKGDNDGVLIPEQTKIGIEKDVAFIKSSHVGLLYNKTVIKYVNS
ncbi:MAG: hypothetical protein KA177_07545, partial [Paludibacter sp.]|nr:hypothetical protein [Paludibacter sp.]MBP8783494.1 hypothetical protein [Paludibacter sp.]